MTRNTVLAPSDFVNQANLHKLVLWDFEGLVGISLCVEDHELVGQL